jgi:hypothetical protein
MDNLLEAGHVPGLFADVVKDCLFGDHLGLTHTKRESSFFLSVSPDTRNSQAAGIITRGIADRSFYAA